jgi:hypothetical protein
MITVYLLTVAQFAVLTGCLQISKIFEEYSFSYPQEFAPLNAGTIDNLATNVCVLKYSILMV